MKKYKTYEQYISHQKEKTLNPKKRKRWLNEEWEYKKKGFKDIFKEIDVLKECKTALCVCARTGQEVAALKELGIDAVGIDLVPHPPLVIEGDMHDLKFEDNSFDFVFSNSYDHSLYPDKFISEIERVASKYIYLQLQVGFVGVVDEYDVQIVKKSHEVLSLFQDVDILKNEEIQLNRNAMNWHILLKA